MYRKYLQKERDVGIPPKVFLPDGREIRLVPPYLTRRPLYASTDGDVFTCFSHGFKQVRSHLVCSPRYVKKGQKQHKAEQLDRQYNNLLVHHAVLSAWVCPRPEGMECDHLNGDLFVDKISTSDRTMNQSKLRKMDKETQAKLKKK